MGLEKSTHRVERIGSKEVHVWSTFLDVDAERVLSLQRLLTEDELVRAERLRITPVRDRFIVARAFVRQVLARYLEREAGDIRFVYGRHGKPELAEGNDETAIRFNLSHSGNMALMAIARDREVGVDVEQMRPEICYLPLAERFFSPCEVAALRSLPENTRLEAFYTCWTRKEAYIKGCGAGLSLPLDSFDVSLHPREPAALLSHRTLPGEVSRWSIADIPVPPGYHASLVFEGDAPAIRCRDGNPINFTIHKF